MRLVTGAVMVDVAYYEKESVQMAAYIEDFSDADWNRATMEAEEEYQRSNMTIAEYRERLGSLSVLLLMTLSTIRLKSL